jgi:hypothetical protein
MPLERAGGTEVNARANRLWERRIVGLRFFFAEAICEPYVREEEARLMNGL